MKTFFANFWADEKGATAIEYALIAGTVSIAAVASMRELPTILNGMFEDAKDGLNN